MTGISRINFEALADKFDFSPYKTLCDVGGATGLLCIEVAKKHPHLQCVSLICRRSNRSPGNTSPPRA